MRLTLSVALAMALAAALPARADPLPAGDPARGADIYDRCIACHSLERNRTGPRHCGLFGRKAGTVPGFHYTRAMKESGIVWTRETLDKFLENPRKVVPGTAMTYAGVRDPQERADLIAYLESANADKQKCPPQ
ncbi:MAG TPA: cytochrome c family protein [Alphaproteobacteria bacterium]